MLSDPIRAETLALILFGIGFLKIIIIAGLIFNTHDVNHNDYNRKAIDYRYAAERIMVNCFMAILGILRYPHPSLGNHSKKHFANYRGEAIFQASMKSPLHTFYRIAFKELLNQFLAMLQETLVGKQKFYHYNEYRRMAKMDGRLEKMPEIFTYVVIGIVVVDLVIGYLVEFSNFSVHHWIEAGFHTIAPIMIGLTVGGVSPGIQYQIS